MIVLVVGSGGREHALALALARENEVHIAPGNPGTAAVGTNHPLVITDAAAVVTLARELEADLVVIGPEAPLVAGVADDLRDAGFAVFGPGRAAAQLEGSKAFAKDVMAAANVPTAASFVCETPEQAAAALDSFGPTYVVKDDGLAAGKGVVVTDDREAALAHAASCERVVIEEFLDGPEVSLFAICDGTIGVPLPAAQDFKRVGDDDTGPNTGGMGAYSPLPWAPPNLTYEVMHQVVGPTLAEMNRRGTPFVGLLYVGLALTSRGLRVVEFNARFGDPETQVVLARHGERLGELLHAAATGQLNSYVERHGEPRPNPEAAVVVVVAAEGYPGAVTTGTAIALPPDTDNAYVVHAGTKLDEGRLVSSGGRVLGVVGLGADLEGARMQAYDHVAKLTFPGGFWRRDIALKAADGVIRTPLLD